METKGTHSIGKPSSKEILHSNKSRCLRNRIWTDIPAVFEIPLWTYRTVRMGSKTEYGTVRERGSREKEPATRGTYTTHPARKLTQYKTQYNGNSVDRGSGTGYGDWRL